MPDLDLAKDLLRAHVNRRLSLTPAQEEHFLAAFRLKYIKKRQFIIQPDFPVRSRYFVLEGAFRAYVVSDEGQEHTIQFAINDWWISDYNSYIFQRPASMFVVALEDSQVFQIDYDTEQHLKAGDHSFETFFRILAEGTAAHMARRVITSLTLNAEQRYETFLAQYPQVAASVPQYALASYLGMTTEYLSKLRNKRVVRKS